MNFLTGLHVLNITAIMLLAFYIRSLQGNKPYSLLLSILFLFFVQTSGIKWFLSHPIYLVRQILFIVLMAISVILIGQLIENSIFNRPIYLLLLSPLAWSFVLWNTYLSNQPTNKA